MKRAIGPLAYARPYTCIAFRRISLVLCLILAAMVGRSSNAMSGGSSFTLPIVNSTGLDAATYSIYVAGFSTLHGAVLPSQLQFDLNGNGTLAPFPGTSGNLPVSVVGSGAMQITLPADVDVAGGLVYFFIGPPNAPPTISYDAAGNVTAPTKAPNTQFPPYMTVEFSVSNQQLWVDVTAVDSFLFPISLTLGGGPATVGQPTTDPAVNQQSIFAAFAPFMNDVGTVGTPFLPLQYSVGLLNPYTYLSFVDPATGDHPNVVSPLNTYFDSALVKLFKNKKLSLQVPGSGAIPTQAYTVTSIIGASYPGSTFKVPALQFKGADGVTKFKVFSPIGLTVSTFSSSGTPVAITGTITAKVLTFDTPLPAGTLAKGMYAAGAGLGFPPPTVTALTLGSMGAIKSVLLSVNAGNPAPHSQYTFSRVPTIFESSGSMVFGNDGVFADAVTQFPTDADSQTVLASLENQIVTALNRGVANVGPTSGAPGFSTSYWGTETNWYPVNQPQNCYALFLHVGVVTVDTAQSPIFTQPVGAATNAAGQVMGQAYGFGFDESPGPIPPAPSGQPSVPAEFSGLAATGTPISITLGAWMPPSAVSMVNGSLLVVGTEEDDLIFVSKEPEGRVRVIRNGEDVGVWGPVMYDIVVLGRGGDDVLKVALDVNRRAVIHGGAGNDFISGGHAADLLDGGIGDDVIFGNGGDDDIDGGDGEDEVHD